VASFGASRGVHAQKIAQILRAQAGRGWLRGGTCRANIEHLRELDRDLQSARVHAVAAGGKTEREMLPRIHRQQKRVTQLWAKFATSCLRKK
jgi:hypothetical protein